VIVVSHRGPYRFVRNDDGSFEAHRGAGGIVSALVPLLAELGRESTWVAATMSDDDEAAVAAGAGRELDLHVELLALDPDLHRLHYDVVSNGVLWFLFHGLFDRIYTPSFDVHFREAWEGFVAVNQSFADRVAEVATRGDVVLVQDYQLALVPMQLRALRPDLRIVHFTHTPFCGPDDLRMLPIDVAETLCRSLGSVPAGFHTTRWARTFQQSARSALGSRAHLTTPFAASLGPDFPSLDAVAASAATREAADTLADAVGDRLVVLRTDRVEPSKNIVRGFHAFDRLLEARPGARQRVVFVAMLYPSRGHLPEYLAYANEIEQVVARVNDRWATRDWTPIVLDDRDDFPRSVAGMQRYDVLFVNPVRDGLNLVAKEGPLLNRRDGVLCLSPEAGAYEELRTAALPAHPFDIEQTASALDAALAMPMDERGTRAEKLRALAGARTPSHWLADLLDHAPKQP
jgi:trehalose 6-phosphate synthase